MKIYSVLAAAFLVFTTACTTKPPSCADHFADGEAPVIIKESLAGKTKMLCFEGYAVTHSGVSRTPLWSAERLTSNRIEAAEALKRKNTFHAEDQLPASDRAELADYARSGFDRGHMAPSGDMATETAQYQSFSLANIIPQHPKNNQNIWANIEEKIRNLASKEGEVYVVTGPIFEGASLQRLNGRVLVPTAVFKAIYVPARKEAGAYVTPNAPGTEYESLSIAELEQRIGINVFPRLPAEIKESKMELPAPALRRSRNTRNAPNEVAPSTR
jgi:endonuclease G